MEPLTAGVIAIAIGTVIATKAVEKPGEKVGETLGNYYAGGDKQNLTEVAAEIQKLLEQLSKSYSTDKKSSKMQVATEAIKSIENNPSLAKQVTSALKVGGTEALAQLLNHPSASLVINALEDWQ